VKKSATTHEIADGIFAYVQTDGGWFVNNTGFLAGRDGITSIDTCATEARTRAYLDAVRAVTGRPVRTLVNTHHHGDHTYGNYLLPDATIIGHKGVRSALLAWGTPPRPAYWTEADWGDIRLAPPFVTFEDAVTIHVGDLACEVRYVGTPAHTVSDSIVWIPEHRVLFSGDLLFNRSTPLMSHGSIAGALQVLGELTALGPETIIPGHGPVGDGSMIDDVGNYLVFVQDVAREAMAAGLTPLEAARECHLGDFAELSDPERLVGNLHRAYAELSGAAPGDRIDLDAAFRDMVAYNGGRPLDCHA